MLLHPDNNKVLSNDCSSHLEINGFTLIEVAVVLVIMGLLVGMGAGLMGPLTKRVKLSETRETVREAYNAIIGYAIANKMLPSALTALSTKTEDAYTNSLAYDFATNLDSFDLCTTQGTYLTVNDKGTNKTNVAFVVFSPGENMCNQTGAGTPFTISDKGVMIMCIPPAGGNRSYDDTVMYTDISTLREKICNTFRIVTDSLPNGTEEVAYPASVLQATDGTAPYAWSISGMTQGTNGCAGSDYPIDSGSNTGICMTTGGSFSGTSILDGVYSFTVSITDAESRTATKSLSITINPNDPAINTDVLHYSSVGLIYNATIAASGGAPPYNWSIISGALPPTLNLAGNTISGGPLTTAGTYAFTVQITDQRTRTATKSLSIAVNN